MTGCMQILSKDCGPLLLAYLCFILSFPSYYLKFLVSSLNYSNFGYITG